MSRSWRWPAAPGRQALLFLLTAACYAAGSGAARLILNETGLSAVFFIPAGVTVAFLLRLERRLWWVVLLAAAVTEYAMNLLGGYSHLSQVSFVAANVVEPLVGALIVIRGCGEVDLARVRHVLFFVIGAVSLGPIAGAAVGSLGAQVGGDADFWATFMQWWLGDALGVVMAGSAILVWGSSPDRRSFVSPWGVLIVAGTVFTLGAVLRSGLPVTFLVLVGVVVSGAVFGIRAVMITAWSIAVMYAANFIVGSGPLIVGLSDATALVIFKLGLMIFTLAGLLVGAEAYESDRARESEGDSEARLEVEQAEKRVFREVAEQLQRALLPDDILHHPDLDVAVRYEAGTREMTVGGDWYDMFELPDGRVAITVGDVVGHGIQASAAMGQMRTAISVLAPTATGPGSLLASLGDFASTTDATSFATAVVGVLTPATGTLTYAAAGHPPLLVVEPDRSTRWLWDGRSTPLGCGPPEMRPEATIALARGSVVVAFSDGLVERRGEDMAQGLARVERICSGHHDLSPHDLGDVILGEMLDGPPEDDVVVLIFRYGAAVP